MSVATTKRTGAVWGIIAAAAVWSGCNEVPTAEIDMTTAEVVAELAAATTPAAADQAIRNVLIKSGVGVRSSDGRYEEFVVSDAEIAELAQAHVDFMTAVSPGARISDLHGSMLDLAEATDGRWEFRASLDQILRDLQQASSTALASPERPANALLVTIVAEGAAVPQGPPLYDGTTVRSPVQTFLLTLWVHKHFDDGKFAEQKCRSNCMVEFVKAIGVCQAIHHDHKARRDCLEAALAAFKTCLDGCHDQGGVVT